MPLVYLIDKSKKIDFFRFIEENNGFKVGDFYFVKDVNERVKKFCLVLNVNLDEKIKNLIENFKLEISFECPKGILELFKMINEEQKENKVFNFIKELFKELYIKKICIPKEKIEELLLGNNFFDFEAYLDKYNQTKVLMDEKTIKMYKKIYYNTFKEVYDLQMKEHLKKGFVYSSFPLIFKLENVKEILKDFGLISRKFNLYMIKFSPNYFFYLNLKPYQFLNKTLSLFYQEALKEKVLFFIKKNKLIVITEKTIDVNSKLKQLREIINLGLKESFVFKGKDKISVYYFFEKLLILKKSVKVDEFLIRYSYKKSEVSNLDKDIVYLEALVNFNK